MRIGFDEAKNIANLAKHGLSLDLFSRLNLAQSVQQEDRRREYGEERWRIFAPLDGRLCTAIVTPRGNGIRVISLRKSNARERRLYEKILQEH